MLDLLREILQTLGHNKLRTALTGFAVAWGIFMLVTLLGLSNGLERGFRQQMLGHEPVISLWGGVTSLPYKGYSEGRRITLRTSDLPRAGQADRHRIADASAELSNDTAAFSTWQTSATTGYRGISPRFFSQNGNYTVTAGRAINQADLNERRRSVMLRDEKARLLFGSEQAAIGRQVRAMGLSWTVVGTFSTNWDGRSLVPYTTAKALAGDNDRVETITLAVANINDEADVEAVNGAVTTALAEAHDFDPSDTGAVWLNNQMSQRLSAQRVMGVLMACTWAIGLLTLLSGVVGVSNIMFVSVKERTHELGIRRAIGARRGSIIRQVVAESILITTLCGYAGVVVGTALLAAAGPMLGEFFVEPRVDIRLALEMTGVLVVCGALAGLLPALKATKVKPVEALRYE